MINSHYNLAVITLSLPDVEKKTCYAELQGWGKK